MPDPVPVVVLGRLAIVSAWFTEGFETRDLQDAQALLAELT